MNPCKKIPPPASLASLFLGLAIMLVPLTAHSKVAKADFSAYLEILKQAQQQTPIPIPGYTIVINNNTPQVTYQSKEPEKPQARPVPLPEVSVSFSQAKRHSYPDIDTPAMPSATAPLADTPAADSLEPEVSNTSGRTAYLAIIIDDVGNNRELDMRAAKLPGVLTLAVLPHTPFNKMAAELAFGNNKEIILHAPMENDLDRPLGEGALTKALSRDEFIQVLQTSIDDIPHIRGINNHMGSLLTKDEQAMRWVMQTLLQNELFFIDSRTTAESVAEALAWQYGISHASRNVFLDNEQTEQYVHEAFEKALALSKKTGFALAIGHPYPATISYLEKTLPDIEARGFTLLKASDYAAKKTRLKQARLPGNELVKK